MSFRPIAAAIVTIVLLPAWQGWTAPPEVVGMYNGTLAYKTWNMTTGEKSSGKISAVLQINANDTFTLGLNNFYFFAGTGVFGTTVGSLKAEDAFHQMHSTLHFKGPAAKGLFQDLTLTGQQAVMEAKLSLKRQP